MEQHADAAPIAVAHALLNVSAFDPDFCSAAGIQGEEVGFVRTSKKKKPAVSAQGRELGLVLLLAHVRNLNVLLIWFPSGLRSRVRFAPSPVATCSSRAAASATGRVQDSRGVHVL